MRRASPRRPSSRPGTRRGRSDGSSTRSGRSTRARDVVVVDDASTDEPPPSPKRTARRCSGCRSTSASAAPCRPGSGTRSTRGTTSRSGSTATASTTRRRSPKLLAPIESGDADLVIGSRFVDPGGTYRPPFARRMGIRVFARLVSVLGGQRVTDTTSGFVALDRAGIELFAAEYPHDYPEVEATLVALRSGLRLAQVQVEMRERRRARRRSPSSARSTTSSR